MKIGKSYIKNSDGSYTLTNVDHLKLSDWAKNYRNYSNQYMCDDFTKTTCTELNVISPEVTKLGILYESLDNTPEKGILYGNSYTYDGSNYHLEDTIATDVWVNIYSKLDNNHYTCLNKTGTCKTLYYITDTKTSSKSYYELTNGQGINDLIDKMLHTDDVNKINSTAKNTLEQWYEDNLINYTNSIEDTIYCNNRNLSDLGNLNPNGGSTSKYTNIYFDGQSSLTCPNINDRFTVSKENGNGKLKYPIGLLTSMEAQLAGTGVLGTSQDHWLMTPYSYNTDFKYAGVNYVSGANISYDSTNTSQYLIPLISLKNDIG
ncbi:MAG: hypothetical protein K2H20_00050, partial [Bacilli bacterium]|nr:hypothetical protein [Bacilli bacterium]